VPDPVKSRTIRLAHVLGDEDESPRRRLTRRVVLDAALALIDEGGLEACSMRALAERLGVTPRAPYRHVADKEDLLRGVAGLILGQMALPTTSLPWRRRVHQVMVELKRVIQLHPNAAPIFARPGSSAPREVVAITDSVVGALRQAGLGGEPAVRAFYAMFNYVLGFTLAGASIRTADPTAPPPNPFAGIDPASVPYAAEVAPFLRRFSGEGLFASDEQFGFGLDLLIDSLERRQL
jgi:TetR/AcrR family transcriptional regulator, tetracycline repressor protein